MTAARSEPAVPWVHAVRRGWVVRGEVPGPDVDEFAEPERIAEALAAPGAEGTLLAVQHPHRTPEARRARLGLTEALPAARAALRELRRTGYRPVADVVAPYRISGADGESSGVLCMVDPAAVDAAGISRVRHGEEVYPDVVAERAAMLAGLGTATSAAMLVPVTDGETLTAAVRETTEALGEPEVVTVDATGWQHRLWLLGPGPQQERLLAVAGRHPLLVADGNHRVAAAAAARLDGLLSLVTAGPRLRIGPIHRVLTGTGLAADALAAAWRRVGLRVRPAGEPVAPQAPGSVTVLAGGSVLRVDLPAPESGEPLPRIDHAVVERLLVQQALGIDPEGPMLRPLPGHRPPPPAADAVLLLAPVPYADVLAVHAQGRRMPRKSTYFTPKPRSGLLLADLGP
ncbi:DUF1015 family protein [Gandjariella thermophila]|uniref:DUF1015 domain-containing protein n=1 Tax=Gandjariella thermophila TaxID=1931992 RepID=A0A4D4JGR2_9PSEU|nr:DUF1015 family protein [Gandjariella thermophila]GDY33596.1 hypothetical protein GTS_52290 [Gandjariella thermophila]